MSCKTKETPEVGNELLTNKEITSFEALFNSGPLGLLHQEKNKKKIQQKRVDLQVISTSITMSFHVSEKKNRYERNLEQKKKEHLIMPAATCAS